MQRFKNILYFADAALETCSALERAVNLAKRNHARLSVLDVLPAAEAPVDFQHRLGMGTWTRCCASAVKSSLKRWCPGFRSRMPWSIPEC